MRKDRQIKIALKGGKERKACQKAREEKRKVKSLRIKLRKGGENEGNLKGR